MGRKTRNKISKNKYDVKDEEDKDEYIYIDEVNLEKKQDEYNDKIFETLRKITDYIDELSLPLCESISYESLRRFTLI